MTIGYLLFFLLVLISVGCFLEGELTERRWLKLLLSLLLCFIIPIVMTGSVDSLLANSGVGFGLYIVIHTVIPTISFFIFQLLLYEIEIFRL